MMRGLYVHIPFCVKKCAYCDFYSLSGRLDSLSPYIKAVLSEARKYEGLDFQTLFLGGGTPSVLGIKGLQKLLVGLHHILDLSQLTEATIEANPDSISAPLLKAARMSGINRISIGVQSLSDIELKKVGRLHSSSQAIDAIKLAETSGFLNISCDIILGLPGQERSSLLRTLETLIGLNIQHISLYCLSLEPHTPLGIKPPPDLPAEDEQADFYENAGSFLKKRGFVHYEISNFSLPGYECRHNLNYWRGGEYVGLGTAAASHLSGRRFKNKADLDAYLGSPTGLIEGVEFLDDKEKAAEEAILRLRLLREGLDIKELAARFDPTSVGDLIKRLNNLVDNGLLAKKDSSYRLPETYALVSNPILASVLGE